MQEEKDAILNEETIISWLDLYPIEKGRFLRNQPDSLNDRQNLGNFFLSYIGAIYLSNRCSTRPILEEWIIKLISSPSDQAEIIADRLGESSPQAPDPPRYTPPPPPQHFTTPLTPPRQSSSSNHLSTPPSSPIAGPSSNSPTTQVVRILNQTADQKHISYNYPAERVEGADHTPVWVVRCLLDGQEKGCGRGSSKKTAKEKAAHQAIVKMGWPMNG